MSTKARILLAAIAFFIVDLVITPFWSGWLVQARLDPLLALPPRLVTCTLPIAMVASLPQRDRRKLYAALLFAVTAFGMLLTAGMGARMAWLQHGVLALVSGAWFLLGDALLHHGRERWAERRMLVKVGVVLLAILLGLSATFAVRKAYQPPQETTPLALLTGLPLVWSEDEGALTLDQAAPRPALQLLDQRFTVTPLDALTAQTLPQTGPLLIAHPRALAPGELVALDAWVRQGGKVLILADAFLAWEPPYALGDTRNPPITSLLTPLFDHWGLDLVLPASGPDTPVLTLLDANKRLTLAAAGVFSLKNKTGDARCMISLGGARADCTIGKGKAILLSDADMLHEKLWLAPTALQSGGVDLSPALWRADNMGWVADTLNGLSGQTAQPALADPVWARLHNKE